MQSQRGERGEREEREGREGRERREERVGDKNVEPAHIAAQRPGILLPLRTQCCCCCYCHNTTVAGHTAKDNNKL